jgi:hypothetical protein
MFDETFFLFNLWKSPNLHHHLKVMCIMFPRDGLHLYHFYFATSLLLFYFQTQMVYPPYKSNSYFKHHLHSLNLLVFILLHCLMNTLIMTYLKIHLIKFSFLFQILLKYLPSLTTLLKQQRGKLPN